MFTPSSPVPVAWHESVTYGAIPNVDMDMIRIRTVALDPVMVAVSSAADRRNAQHRITREFH